MGKKNGAPAAAGPATAPNSGSPKANGKAVSSTDRPRSRCCCLSAVLCFGLGGLFGVACCVALLLVGGFDDGPVREALDSLSPLLGLPPGLLKQGSCPSALASDRAAEEKVLGLEKEVGQLMKKMQTCQEKLAKEKEAAQKATETSSAAKAAEASAAAAREEAAAEKEKAAKASSDAKTLEAAVKEAQAEAAAEREGAAKALSSARAAQADASAAREEAAAEKDRAAKERTAWEAEKVELLARCSGTRSADTKTATVVTPAQAALAVVDSPALLACDPGAITAQCPDLHDALRTWQYGINQLAQAIQGTAMTGNLGSLEDGYIAQIAGELNGVLAVPQTHGAFQEGYATVAHNNRMVFQFARSFLEDAAAKAGGPLSAADESIPRPARGLLCSGQC